jgi:hypothetical protein
MLLKPYQYAVSPCRVSVRTVIGGGEVKMLKWVTGERQSEVKVKVEDKV